MTELWHFSEDPTIEVFVPHHREPTRSTSALVWAVDSDAPVAVLVPARLPARDVVRRPETSDEDVDRWLDGDRSRASR